MSSDPMKSRLEIVLLLSLCIVSVLSTLTLFDIARGIQLPARHIHKQSNLDLYTLIGDDFPPTVPNLELGSVAMVVEESVRYSLRKSRRRGNSEWFSAFPSGTGTIRLGPDHRAFYIGLYHQNHCLQQYRNTWLRGTANIEWDHIHHCLNSLRLWSLCLADLTLEPGDFTTRNFTEDRLGVTHTCRDWDAAIDKVKTDWDNWIPVWKDLHNVSMNSDEPDKNFIS